MVVNFGNRWLYNEDRSHTRLFKLYRRVSPLFFKTFTRKTLELYLPTVLLKHTRGITLEVGAKHSPFKKHINYTVYETIDISPNWKPTFCEDLHTTRLPANTYDTVIAIEVLEHLHSPQKAIHQIRRLLKKGGAFIATTPFIYPYHGVPHDMYRFTEYGLRHLLKDFQNVEIIVRGNRVHVLIDLLCSWHKIFGLLKIFLWPLAYLKYKDGCPSGFIITAQK